MSWLAHSVFQSLDMLNLLLWSPLRNICATIVLFLISCTVFAQSNLSPPKQVSAMVYSSSAAELFWTPTDALVQISLNGEILGRLDARSLFLSGLDASKNYRYVLRTIDSTGATSSPVVVSLTTQNFSLPIKRVQPVDQSDDNTLPPPPELVSLETATPTPVPVTLNSVASEPLTNAPEIQATTPDVLANDQLNTDQPEANIVQTSTNCIARDINGLLSCVRNANSYQRIDIANDLSCTDNCCPNAGALLRFDNVRNLDIVGHGNRLLRTKNQRQCSLLDINNSSNISISGLKLDDDQGVSGCQVAENCPRMVHVRGSSSIAFIDTHISHGKGYAFYVQGTNGFRFERSSLHNSGVLGMYIGHGNDASSNVQITQSTFSDNQTNGLALLGVKGTSLTSNLVADNVFVRNHRMGQWAVEPKYGTGFTGGGQLYVAQASNITVRNNLIKDGYCENCFVQRANRSGVSGIELGRPNQQSITNVSVRNNTILNLDGFGISQNANSNLTGNVSVRDNILLNTTNGEHLQGVSKSGNRIQNTQQFDSFENASDLGGRFQSDVSCSSGGSVTQQCGGESLFGQCAVQLKLSEADCDNAQASLVGPKSNIQAGQVAVMSGWVRAPVGRWCAQFRDSSGNLLSEQCRNLSGSGSSNVQPYVGMPSIEATAPEGSATVQLYVQHKQAGATMWLDDLKLSVGAGR